MQPVDTGNEPDWLERLPASVRDTLDPKQRNAIVEAMKRRPWSTQPVNLRVSVPLPGRRMFFTLIGGAERRSRERRGADRQRHPLNTVGNLLFVIFSLTGIYAIALFFALLGSSILEL